MNTVNAPVLVAPAGCLTSKCLIKGHTFADSAIIMGINWSILLMTCVDVSSSIDRRLYSLCGSGSGCHHLLAKTSMTH